MKNVDFLFSLSNGFVNIFNFGFESITYGDLYVKIIYKQI